MSHFTWPLPLLMILVSAAIISGSSEIREYRLGSWPAVLSSLHMTTATTGWALSASDALLRTTDGGQQWTDVTPQEDSSDARAVSFLNAEDAWVAVSHPNGLIAVARTRNGGHTWQWTELRAFKPPAAFTHSRFPLELDFIDPSHGWLLVQGEGMHSNALALFQTDDGGQRWRKVAACFFCLPISGLLGFHTLARGWATDEHAGGAPAILDQQPTNNPDNTGPFYATYDGGHTWRYQQLPVPSGYSNSLVSPFRPQFCTTRDGILPAMMTFNQMRKDTALEVYDTQDGGRTWRDMTPLPLRMTTTAVTSTFVGCRYGWVMAGTALYMTGNGARRWSRIGAMGALGTVKLLNFVTPHRGWALVYQAPDQSATLFQTVDGGIHWVAVHPRVARERAQ